MPEAFLVTGASGFLGTHLVQHLARRHPSTTTVGVGRLRSTRNVIGVDTRLAALDKALRNPQLPHHYDVVFHLAAATPKRAGDEEPEPFVDANVLGTQHVLRAVEGRAGRVVFASTLDVYAPSPVPITEESAVGPRTAYGASKLLAEALVRAWGTAKKTPTTIVRVGHLYGPGEGAYEKLIPVAIRDALAGRPVRRFGAGDEKRDLLYVTDAAEGLAAIGRLSQDGVVDRVNLVHGEPVAVRTVLEVLCDEVGGAVVIEELPASRTPHSIAFDARCLRELGFSPKTSLREGLRAEIAWFRANARP
jgi:UDP-glucose 4-epimerase